MTRVTQIERWKTTDGASFPSMTAALDHQERLDEGQRVHQLIADLAQWIRLSMHWPSCCCRVAQTSSDACTCGRDALLSRAEAKGEE